MISYFRFLLLTLNEKKVYLNDNGTFLLNKENEKGIINLYALGDFFVEWYCYKQENAINEVIIFKNLDRLQYYTEDVDLVQLINWR